MARPVTYDQVPLCPSISLARALRNLQQQDSLCDLTLVAEDHKKVRVHKAVFAAMSGYIQKRVNNKQVCDSFILTGISVDGIRSLAEFVYGNVYAIHSNNVEEVYPIAVLLEFHLLCKVAEYIDPDVRKLKWTNKIIPVSPNLLSKRPTKISQARKQAEENNNNSNTPDTSEDPSSEEETSQSSKRKRTVTKSPTPKVQQAKRAKKDDEDEGKNTEKAKEDVKNPKVNDDTKNVKKSPAKRTVKDGGEENKKPIITQQLKITLQRVDHEIRSESPRSAPAKSPEKTESPRSKNTEHSQETPAQDKGSKKEPTTNGKETPSTKGKKESAINLEEETALVKEKKEVTTDRKDENPPDKETPSKKEKKEATTNRKEDNSPDKEATPTTNKTARKSKQPEETVFECGRCQVIFTSLQKCNEHMAEAHNVSMVSVNKNFICSRAGCGFKCDDAETLKNHVLVKHPQALVKKHKCGICDAELGSLEALEAHVSAVHTKKGSGKEDRSTIKINGKDNNDEPELDRSTGELKVTNRPGPKSSKLKQRKSLPESPNVNFTSKTETKTVNGQKIKVTYVNERLIRIEDDSLLEGWSKLLVARKDLSKYDMYVQSPDGKKHRSLNDLLEYLDGNQIEMETDHLSFGTSQLMEEAGIPPPSGAKNKTPRRRSNKSGPKSSKKIKENELSDEEMDVDENGDDDGEKKVNGSIDDDVNEMEEGTKGKKSSKEEKDDLKETLNESDTPSNVHRVELHAF